MCIFFPSVVVTYHYFWQECQVTCKTSPQQSCESNEGAPRAQNRARFIKPIGELFKCVVNWFEGPYVDYVIIHPVIRWVVLAFFVSASIVFLSFAVQLRPDEEQVSTGITLFI